MSKSKLIILMVFAVLALVSVASAGFSYNPINADISFCNAPTSYWNVDVNTGSDSIRGIADKR